MPDLITCFICDGQGFFILNPDNYGGWFDCPECHGKGWLTEQEVEDNKATWLNDSYRKSKKSCIESDIDHKVLI